MADEVKKISKETKLKLKEEIKSTKEKIKQERKQRSAKGRKVFLAFFIIILLISASVGVFYLGLVNVKLDDNQLAVMHTKTFGYYPQVIDGKSFIWRWEKLIPTNTKIIVYKTEKKVSDINIETSLPSGDIYSLLIDGVANFKFDIKFKVFYRINPATLIEMAEKNILPADSELYVKQFEENFKDIAVQFLQEQSTNEEFVKMLANDINSIQALLIDYSKTKYPYILIEKISIDKLNFPDISLYYKAREYFLKSLDNPDTRKLKELNDTTQDTLKNSTHLNNLEDLAKLLTKYPALLEYFKATKNFSNELPAITQNKE